MPGHDHTGRLPRGEPPTVDTGFECYGVRVLVRTGTAVPGLEDFLPPLRRPVAGGGYDCVYTLAPAAGGTGHALWAGAEPVARAAGPEQLLHHLESHLQLHVGENAPGLVFVHAGVVQWHGAAVVIPGRTHSGKSTLVRALLEAGATYYSDEFAVLDPVGRVHPYPRLLSLRGPGGAVARRPAAAFGAAAGGPPLAPGLFLLTRYRPGGGTLRGAPVGAAVLEIARHSLPIRRRPEAVLAAVANALRGALVLRGPRGEASGLVPAVARLCAGLGAGAPEGRRVPGGEGAA